jgi:hypothetical protein
LITLFQPPENFYPTSFFTDYSQPEKIADSINGQNNFKSLSVSLADFTVTQNIFPSHFLFYLILVLKMTESIDDMNGNAVKMSELSISNGLDSGKRKDYLGKLQ